MFNVYSHARIETLAVEGVSEGAIVAAQDPVEERYQHLVEEEASQDTNLRPVSYTTDQGKPWCIPPIILSLSHVLYIYIYMSMHLSFIGFDWNPPA